MEDTCAWKGKEIAGLQELRVHPVYHVCAAMVQSHSPKDQSAFQAAQCLGQFLLWSEIRRGTCPRSYWSWCLRRCSTRCPNGGTTDVSPANRPVCQEQLRYWRGCLSNRSRETDDMGAVPPTQRPIWLDASVADWKVYGRLIQSVCGGTVSSTAERRITRALKLV